MRRHIIVSQRASIQDDGYSPGLSGRKIDFRETLKFLDRANYWRIHRSDVQLNSFRPGAFSGISDSKAYSYKAVITLALLPKSLCETVFVLVLLLHERNPACNDTGYGSRV
jgi:hypothetical protein